MYSGEMGSQDREIQWSNSRNLHPTGGKSEYEQFILADAEVKCKKRQKRI